MKVILNIMWVVALLIWAGCFAMGFNYGDGNSLVVSIVLLVVVFAVMGLDVFLLNRWVDPSKNSDRSKAHAKEIASLVVYAVMVALTVSGFARFITVQTVVKSEIRPLAKDKIAQARTMLGNEEVEGSYWAYVSEMSATYRNKQKENNTEEATVNANVARFEDDMMGDGSFSTLREDGLKFLRDCEYSVDNWVPWTVVENLKKLDKNAVDWYEELCRLSDKNEWVVETGEKYESPVKNKEELAAMVTKPKAGDFGILAVVLILLIQIIVLLPYAMKKDWTRKGPAKSKGIPVWSNQGRDKLDDDDSRHKPSPIISEKRNNSNNNNDDNV